MAFDPAAEDYQRLGLTFAKTLPTGDISQVAQTSKRIEEFRTQYRENPDSLAQTDQDRAFHLTAKAAILVDYMLPFEEDEIANSIITKATTLLSEAIELDPACHDAHRMLAASMYTSFNGYYEYLRDETDKVKADCEKTRDTAQGTTPLDIQLARDIAMRPYLRWLFTLASRALICGKYHVAAKTCEKLLELDPQDTSGARFTAALSYAKLEDADGLTALARATKQLRRRNKEDAWMLLARLSLAFKAGDEAACNVYFNRLVRYYPHAPEILHNQNELPDSVFGRILLVDFSEDELVIATSEATVLLEEGYDNEKHGPLGNWLQAKTEELVSEQDAGADDDNADGEADEKPDAPDGGASDPNTPDDEPQK